MNQFNPKCLKQPIIISEVLIEIARGAGILVILASCFVAGFIIGAMIGGGA